MNTLFTTRLSHGPSWEWVVFYPFVGFHEATSFQMALRVFILLGFMLCLRRGGGHAPLPGTLAHALPGQGSTPQG